MWVRLGHAPFGWGGSRTTPLPHVLPLLSVKPYERR